MVDESTHPNSQESAKNQDKPAQADLPEIAEEKPSESSLSEPSSQPSPAASAPAGDFEFRNRMREARIRKYEARLKKVYDLAKTSGKVSNDDIQKHLRVSDATASRYARELVKRGLLRKSGNRKSTRYEAN